MRKEALTFYASRSSPQIMIQLSLPLLRHHQYQAQTNDCAPFTVAIVVNALKGENLSGEQMAQEMNRPRWSTGPIPFPIIRRIPNWATFPWGIADELQRRGIRARWRFGAHEADLLKALQEDRITLPIGGAFSPLWTHVKILVAHDPEQGWGFLDPAHSRAEITWDRPQRFAQLWRNYGHLLVETLG